MKIAIVGRTEILYDAVVKLMRGGHEIVCILTAKEAPEYTRTSSDFARLADELGVPFAVSSRIVEQLSFFQQAGADIGVSFNYPGVIPKQITSLFRHGILNAHGGDLPRYRGNACQAWAILNGESRIGLCIHRMIGGELDSGDIVAREYLDVVQNTTVTQAWQWMKDKVPALMELAVNLLDHDPAYILETQSTNPGDALRCYPRRPEDGRIDWRYSSVQVLRLINASCKPYSGAFCEYEGQIFRIWEAELAPEIGKFCAVPGQVTLVGDHFVDVACGEGKLRVRLAEYGGQVANPNIWIKSIRKRLT